jgi:hypothetical protein
MSHNTQDIILKWFKINVLWVWRSLWSSGQSSWLQIQRPGFHSRCYQIFWEVVGLETASVIWWSEFLATDPEVRVPFPALPDFLSSGSGIGSTQPLSTTEELTEWYV